MKLVSQSKTQSSAISYTIPVLEYTCKSLNEIVVDYYNMQFDQVSEAHIYDNYKTKPSNKSIITKLRQKVFAKLKALGKLQVEYNDLIKTSDTNDNLGETISDLFFQELKLHCKNKIDYDIACSLLESIDEQGYLTHPLSTLANNFNIDVEELLAIKKTIQKIEPIGVTSRDFDEYALIYIQSIKDKIIQKKGTQLYSFYIDFFKNHSRNFRLNSQKTLSLLQIDAETCRTQLQELQKFGIKLNPITQHQLKKKAPVAELQVSLHNNNLTISSINDLHSYANLKKTDIEFYSNAIEGIDDPELLKKMASQLVHSRSQLYAVYIRMDNLTRISKAILSAQLQWFLHGDGAMNVLRYQDISDATGISKSVVCRCVNEKYILFNDQLIELKSFFSTGVKDKNGQLHSRIKIKHSIKMLIHNENKKTPLSDVKLQKAIESNYNIKLTVRVVAKYRNELKIPDYSSRRSG
ncbi:MAG: hypothetical protein KC646_00165 [Candidatus Cloacimonetes bacterium]|nr:hypothetical protein [Candidatus Cloacimonadota bacterium]